MFVLRITYLLGRVYAADFDDGDAKAAVEWPPHPSRLYSALVAAWAEGGEEPELRPALEWLEAQPAPAIYAGSASPRRMVNTFVPVNDICTLPEDRPRKGRVFPSAAVEPSDVFFAWSADPPEELRGAFRAILGRTCSVGHPASLVMAEVAEGVPTGGYRQWTPSEPGTGTVRLRIPYEGRLAELVESHRRWSRTGNKVFRPAKGITVPYREPVPAEVRPVRGIFREMIVLVRRKGPGASLRSTLALTSALRGAILRLAPQPPPEFLSGHALSSTPEQPVRSEQPHVAIIPLPFVGGRYATGSVLGLAALLPQTVNQHERLLAWGVLSQISKLDFGWGSWEVELADAEERRETLRPETWMRRGKTWATVTPFVFDRYPKEAYGAEAESIVREALVRSGFPEPADIDLHYNPWHIGVPKAAAFPPAPARAGKPRRFHCHVWVRFDKEVQGPVVAGAGRYYGYGLFQPVNTSGNGGGS